MIEMSSKVKKMYLELWALPDLDVALVLDGAKLAFQSDKVAPVHFETCALIHFMADRILHGIDYDPND